MSILNGTLRLFRFKGGETDWVAARDKDEAIATLLIEYELDETDLDGTEITLVEDPESVPVWLDEVDAETAEQKSTTAAAVMADMTGPGFIASSANL